MSGHPGSDVWQADGPRGRGGSLAERSSAGEGDELSGGISDPMRTRMCRVSSGSDFAPQGTFGNV